MVKSLVSIAGPPQSGPPPKMPAAPSTTCSFAREGCHVRVWPITPVRGSARQPGQNLSRTENPRLANTASGQHSQRRSPTRKNWKTAAKSSIQVQIDTKQNRRQHTASQSQFPLCCPLNRTAMITDGYPRRDGPGATPSWIEVGGSYAELRSVLAAFWCVR